MAAAAKSVTKTALSTFVRSNTSLNLTQSKALTDQLLDRYDISARMPADPNAMPIEANQCWIHTDRNFILRVTAVETGPIHVPDNPVTVWGPVNVTWEDTQNPSNTGTAPIAEWRAQMAPVKTSAPVPEAPEESSTGS